MFLNKVILNSKIRNHAIYMSFHWVTTTCLRWEPQPLMLWLYPVITSLVTFRNLTPLRLVSKMPRMEVRSSLMSAEENIRMLKHYDIKYQTLNLIQWVVILKGLKILLGAKLKALGNQNISLYYYNWCHFSCMYIKYRIH